MHKKGAHFPFHALLGSPTTGLNRIHGERECAPYGRISTHMPFDFEVRGSISKERLVSVDAKLSCLLAEVGGFLPPYRFIGHAGRVTLPYWLCPFISVSLI